MQTESRTIKLNIRTTKEMDIAVSKKAEVYSAKKATLDALIYHIGYFALIKTENQIEEITFRKHSTPEFVRKLARGEDIGGVRFRWSVKNFLQPAIKQMEVEEMVINGLKSIPTNQEQKEKEIGRLAEVEFDD
ncbi:MAG: hypothetical protein OEL87_00080 [Nanoarchaeota archaeon]|nr:hypothetical protein [Nanoarchaeota archaeon]